jgi:hypothetical protein
MKLKRGLLAAAVAAAVVVMPATGQATAPVVVCMSLSSLIPCPAFDFQRSHASLILSQIEQCDGRRVDTEIRFDSTEGDSEYRGCLPHGYFHDG